MSCEQARSVLSAALDGEAGKVAAIAADDHLIHCAGCRAWLTSLHRLNRVLRLAPAEPSLPTAVALAEWDRARAPLPRALLMRIGLLVVAITNAALVVVLLLGLSNGALGSVGEHLGRDLAAFPATLGAAFWFSAWDGRARGRLGVVAAAIVLLVVIAIVDLAGRRTLLAYELIHLPEAVGLLLLWGLARSEPPSARPRTPLRRHSESGIGRAA